MYMNMTFEEALANVEFKKIIYSASSKYMKYLDPDELESLQMFTLWKCLENYDESNDTKFTTYLYLYIGFAIKNLIRKNKRVAKTSASDKYLVDKTVQEDHKLKMILVSLDSEEKEILEQRYISNMSMKEICTLKGVDRKVMKRKISKVIKKCRAISEICVFS